MSSNATSTTSTSAHGDRRPFTPDESEALMAARLLAMDRMPYLAAGLFAMHPICAPHYPTMAVNSRWQLFINPGFLTGNPCEYIAGVLVHELGHLLRNHAARYDQIPHTHDRPRSARLWNYATDLAINDDLVEAFDMTEGSIAPLLPLPCGLIPGLIEEQYYESLGKGRALPGSLTEIDCGTGVGSDEPEDIDTTAPMVVGVQGDFARRTVAEAIRAAEGGTQGTVPAGLSRWAHHLLTPKVDWRHQLRSVVRRSRRTVTHGPFPTYRRPDRRADSRGDFIYPGTERPVANIAVVVDTSGSMGTTRLDQATSEVQAVLRSQHGEVTLLSCDAGASEPRRIRSLEDVELHGGGGTDMRVGITAAAESRPKPNIIIVLTDGRTPWPDRAPTNTELIAVIIDSKAALPTGRGIQSVRAL